MRRRSSHELLYIRQEEILHLEKRRDLNYGSGAKDRGWERLRIEMEAGRSVSPRVSKVSSEGAVGRRSPELHVAFDAVPTFDWAFKSVDARTHNGELRVR